MTQPLAQPSRQALTVTGLVAFLSQILDRDAGILWVRGEVSGLTVSRLGHAYFTLKDASCQIQCVAFKTTLSRLRFRLTEGTEILLRGRVGIYAARGDLQLIVDFAEPLGVGSLQAEFERLKKKLQAAGLFEASRKRPLPYLPRCVAVITSLSGAALRDVLAILRRRNPALAVKVVPAPVQGVGAGAELAQALAFADQHSGADVLLLTRGGGSAEDLACFNDETLAYEIARCFTPVISAVGHEIDFSISDFVADVRAPTPSAAAELLTPVRAELLMQVATLHGRIDHAMRSFFQRRDLVLRELDARLQSRSPTRRIAEGLQRLDELESRLLRAIRIQLDNKRLRRQHLLQLFQKPGLAPHLERAGLRLERLDQSLRLLLEQRLQSLRNKLTQARSSLQALNPLAVLERGFSVTRRDGSILTRAEELRPGDAVEVQLAQGSFVATVTQIRPS